MPDVRTLPPSSAVELPPQYRPERWTLALPGGGETAAYWYAPRGAGASTAARAVREPVVYLHGIQSHPGWFTASCDALAAAGHGVLAVVRRGSGENTQDRGDAPGAEALLGDVEIACQRALQQSEARRVHLLGVSWGGKLAACYAIWPKRRVEVASLTLVAPGIVPLVDVSWCTKLKIALSLMLCPRRPFPIPLNEPELFTDNPAMQRFLRDDPLRLRHATARFLMTSRLLDWRLSRARGGSLTVPVSLLLAGRERIIDNVRTRRVLDRLTAGRARVVEFDAAHTIEFEPQPTEFHKALVESLGRESESGSR